MIVEMVVAAATVVVVVMEQWRWRWFLWCHLLPFLVSL
jgi:hypothetical protein